MTTSISHPTDRPNYSIVKTENATLYFSYQTLIAFYHDKTGLVVHENIWGVTTGKHLNNVNADKKARVNAAKFAELKAQAGI